MAGSILHFGQDPYHRIPVLEDAGYRIKDCRSVIQLRAILKTGTFADAVVFTAGFYANSEPENAVRRSDSPVPLILFDEDAHPRPNSDFDLVIPVHAPAAQWLGDIRDLIASSRSLRVRSGELIAKSKALTRQAKEIVERTQREMERAKQERAREVPKVVGNWGTVDIQGNETASLPACIERNKLDKSILLSLARLTRILHRMIRAGLNEDPASRSMDSLKVEHHLECATLESFLTEWKDHKRRHKC